MRINRVKHALKKGLKCGNCGKDILPSRDDKKTKKRILGDAYLWIKPRYGGKRIRCTACPFRDSDLTTSEKLGRVYDARDTARDAISQWDGEDLQDLRAAIEDCVNEVREVADEYNESADNIEQSFPNGNPTSEDCREKADELSSWCDEMESVELEEREEEEGDEEGDNDEKRSEWAEAQRDAALGAVDACPV